MSIPNLFTAAALLTAASPADGAPAESRSFDFTCSSANADGFGRVVVQDWDLSRYEQNPVVLWNHGDGGSMFGSVDVDATLPIGRASNVRVEGGKLLATITLVDAAANPIAEKVFQGLKQGSISAVSVGWQAGEARYDEAADALVLSQNLLIEISVVAVPANPDAVRVDAEQNARLAASLLGERRQPVVPTAPGTRLAAALEGATWRGKRFAELDLDQRAELAHTDRALYEAMRDGAPVARTVAAGERALEVLLAATGAPNPDAAFLLLAVIVGKAARYDTEVAALRAEAAVAKAAKIDDLLKKTISAGCLTPAQRGMVLRAHGAKLTASRDPDEDASGSTTGFKLRSLAAVETYDLGGLDVAALEQTLARMPQIMNTEESRARTEAPKHGASWQGKTFTELSFDDRAELAHADYETYQAMRTAAEAEGEAST